MDLIHPSKEYFPWLLDELIERICDETGESFSALAVRLHGNERTLYSAKASRRKKTRRQRQGAISKERIAAVVEEGLSVGAITKLERDRILYAWLRERTVAAGPYAEMVVKRHEDYHNAPSGQAWVRERRAIVDQMLRSDT